ncbi:response regulator [Daejeonella sp.]|uniref:response regulator n=1 Tax=Daejeonella sp. TaxID=2805397 RepID=UPI0039838A96
MKKVLIVDDNEDVSDLIATILREAGYDVNWHSSGNHLISTVITINPDLILMDIMLGKHDGRKLCDELKNNEETAHIPILLVSAAHDLHSQRNQADGFVAKPFDIEYLLHRVASTIN